MKKYLALSMFALVLVFGTASYLVGAPGPPSPGGFWQRLSNGATVLKNNVAATIFTIDSSGNATIPGNVTTGTVKLKDSSGTLAVRGSNDTADAPISASGGTFSGPVTIGITGSQLGQIGVALQKPYLPNVGRQPRILVSGESILNAMELVTQIKETLPSAQVDLRTYGGSLSTLGLVAAADDVQVYTQGGNILKDTRLTQWETRVGVTVAQVASPTTGQLVYRLTSDGSVGQRVSGGNADGAVVVPAGAPNLTFSLCFEPGTVNGFKLSAYNVTKAGAVKLVDFSSNQGLDVTDRGSLPHQYCLHLKSTDGVGYTDGDVIWLYIYVTSYGGGTPAGTCYVSNVMANAGDWPAEYHPTVGTAEASSSAAWLIPAVNARDLYDLTVLQWGANDSATTSAPSRIDSERMLSSMVDGSLRYGSRVLLCTPPPKCAMDFTSWDATDAYQVNKYYQSAKNVAARHGVMFYDAISDYQALVSVGTRTIADLMRDPVHPTVTYGIGRYAAAICAAATAQNEPTPRQYGNSPSVRLGGQPTVGTWAWTTFTSTTAPLYNVHGVLTGETLAGDMRALVSNTPGDTLSYNITGRTIGLIALGDQLAAGVVSVSVDGATPISIDLSGAGTVTFYPHGYFVAGGLAKGPHTVTVTVVSGSPRIVGVVAAP